jgi:hypothetical protein
LLQSQLNRQAGVMCSSTLSHIPFLSHRVTGMKPCNPDTVLLTVLHCRPAGASSSGTGPSQCKHRSCSRVA